MLVLKLLSVFELKGGNGSFFLLISPVPKRDSLWFIVTESDQVVVIHGDIYSFDSVRVWVEVSPNGSARDRVPNY
jgi:hypothetical protein